VKNAKGEYIAFIDDDELPSENWLLGLLKTIIQSGATGVLGPVLPCYKTKPPEWILRGRFHERPSHETGTVLCWTQTRSGNVLIRKDVFSTEGSMFRPEFGSGGEDRDLFRRLIEKGHKFIWCAEAPVYEVVLPERWTRSFMIRRALLRGKTPYNQNLAACVKSGIIIPLYSLFLPVLLLCGHHIFMRFVIRLFDHIGRILAFFRIELVKQKYVVK
jgi:GT2 family glycosyltransferase